VQIRIGWASLPTASGLGSSVRVSRAAALQAARTRDDQLEDALGATVKLRRALTDLRDVLTQRGTAARPARSSSSDGTGMDVDSRSTTLRSTEEVNTTPTSYGPVQPTWTGGSSAGVTVSGVYKGDEGTQTLTIEMSSDGDRTVGGTESIRLKMVDQDGYRVQTVSIAANAPAGTEVTYRNGITLTLGAGTVLQDDTFTLDVSTLEGTAVDPDKALGGTGVDSARLDAGQSVVAGSFEVQGVTIAVDPSDSLHDVLARITASAAGVDATFDSATESVVLTRRDASDGDLVVGGDTSGFLAAVKLDGASATLGHTADQDRVIADVAALSAVTSGSVVVNGTSVAFDVGVDTLSDVLDRIGSEAGVSAMLMGNLVTIQATDGGDLTLSDGGTGLFDALNLRTGTIKAQRGTGPGRSETVEAMKQVTTELGTLYRVAGAIEQLPSVLEGMRSAVEGLVREAAGDDDRAIVRTGVGLEFDFREDAREVVKLTSSGRALERALARNRHAVGEFFGVYERKGEGMLDRLIERLEADQKALRKETGTSTGLLLRTVA